MTGIFNSTGYSEIGHVLQGQKVTVEVSGNFVATILVERQITGNPTDQSVVQTLTAPGVFESDVAGIYRLRCSSFTSGTVGYSLVIDPADEELGGAEVLPFAGTLAQLQVAHPAVSNIGNIAYTSDSRLRVSDGLAWISDRDELSAQLQSPLLATQSYPPFRDNDPSLLLNLGPVITSAKAVAAGMTVNGGTFDPVLGYMPGTSTISKSGLSTGTSGASGTIYFEVERAGISVDKSASAGSTFYDSVGRVATGAAHYIFALIEASPLDIIRVSMGDTSLNFDYYRNNSQTAALAMEGANSYVPTEFDQRFAKCFITWSALRWYLVVDGQLCGTGNFPTQFPTGVFDIIRIGGYDVANLNFGNYYIRRFQISTRFCAPQETGVRIGLIGDSFVVGADARADAVGDTVAQIDTAQTNLTPIASAARRSATIRGQASWMHYLQGLCNDQLGFWPNVYNAGRAGRGWALDLSPIPTAYFDALNIFGPEIVIAFGTVNDPSNGTAAQPGLDTRTRLDYLANRNPLLRKILFFETFSWEASTTGTLAGGPAAWKAKNQAVITDQRAKLEGYFAGSRLVPVTYVRTYELLYPAGPNGTVTAETNRYFYGSHADNTTTSADGGVAADAHPTPEGHLKIASIVWPYLRNALLSKPLRS